MTYTYEPTGHILPCPVCGYEQEIEPPDLEWTLGTNGKSWYDRLGNWTVTDAFVADSCIYLYMGDERVSTGPTVDDLKALAQHLSDVLYLFNQSSIPCSDCHETEVELANRDDDEIARLRFA